MAYVPGWQCAPDYQRPDFSPVEKPTPRKLVKDKAKATVSTTDKHERAKCHERSGGRCEVIELIAVETWPNEKDIYGPTRRLPVRCKRRVSENHHLIGGSGRRNKGESILAAHRLDVCQRCHDDITSKVLVPCVEQAKAECAATVRYERVRLVTERRR